MLEELLKALTKTEVLEYHANRFARRALREIENVYIGMI